jgi:branched-chain amino acid transport system permease protein
VTTATAPGRLRVSPPRWVRLPAQPLLRHLLFGGAAALGFFILTSLLGAYADYQVGEVAAYAIAVAGLSLLTGANGQISLGHGALMAVGAYTLALEQTHTEWNLAFQLILAIAVSALLGVVIGIPATRLSGPYLAGMTLILALGLPLLADQYSSIFGGDQGLGTTPPSPPGSGVGPEEWLAWIEILGALLTMILLANLMRSRFGRAFQAVRDGEVAAALAGVHVMRIKVIAFTVSAACAGLAGAFLGLSVGVVNTGEFPLSLSIGILAGMVLGGAGTLVGAWWGAVALVYLPQWSQSLSGTFNLGSGAAAYLATIIYGLVLIVVIMVAPTGIQGWLRRAALTLRHRHLPAAREATG